MSVINFSIPLDQFHIIFNQFSNNRNLKCLLNASILCYVDLSETNDYLYNDITAYIESNSVTLAYLESIRISHQSIETLKIDNISTDVSMIRADLKFNALTTDSIRAKLIDLHRILSAILLIIFGIIAYHYLF